MARWDFRSQDSREVEAFLTGVYADSHFSTIGKNSPCWTRIFGGYVGDVSLCHVSHSSPISFMSKANRESFLIMACTAGAGTFWHGAEAVDFRPGVAAPISATKEVQARGGDTLAHVSVHISAEAINAFCGRLLGSAVDAPVVLDLTPFSRELQMAWQAITGGLDHLLNAESPSDISIGALSEYAIALLLEKHPHNYSGAIGRDASVSDAALRDAQAFINANADKSITVSDVAAFAGCSINALHKGFCERFGLRPRAYLYLARMAVAHARLECPEEALSAAEIVERCGFIALGRFGSLYRSRYGESPTQTFDRHFKRLHGDGERIVRPSGGALTSAKIDLLRHHITSSLGRSLVVKDLAALVGMSPQSFAGSFKQSFKITPAQYVLTERIKRARWLLVNTNAPISAIAAKTGFSSQSHLTSVLKQRISETPHELRHASRTQ
jgi:transcriptional regulator GlxA family with amidase domain